MYQTRVYPPANQLLGNTNIMNPQQLKWMDKPPGDSSELGYLKPLGSLMVKQVASIVESIYQIELQLKIMKSFSSQCILELQLNRNSEYLMTEVNKFSTHLKVYIVTKIYLLSKKMDF
jgi:hypothetical protein